ncbi:tRNA 2-selenouridine synthase [Meinhardsimonia xiamenensis]|jgi:tRNA 2-selenouridine synthase|uniref:tRNA 2-selenouridine synthase n=1 Tax=Meinhardsimonia xiamenensis TaxID=990712 RepID=A0A1G9GDG5_9RHOB|nr:tRNA 2-selenouridine(34) synthase MnmH [Meinhardsimonia xiamenensis]PRX31945.1 tRNA 2-selenouridine synthase [Meinhardsimonia xiamenensis]SDK98764.1 tRNA 2-selenouridine synthase [Meinhardsimonia xiamenensis]
MAIELTTLEAFRDTGFDTVIDVRSPSEYAEDHLPGAISLPVLDDEERARVGTIYVQQSPFLARRIGAALVARNAAAHLEGPLADKPGGWRPLVYCWRGGQRSGAFATILANVGWRVETLAGGYRSYRRVVAHAMHEAPLAHRLVLLDGNTGTAKTEILARLAARGVQVVDLEGLARHRGSVLGAREGGQPSQKAFEGALAHAFDALDAGRPVVVEAESSKVGNLQIPPSVWKAMKVAPRLTVSAPVEARAAYLVRAYADLLADREALCETLALLIPLQGREQVAAWQAMAREGRFEALAAELMARHYDPRYAKSREGRGAALAEITVGRLDETRLEAAAGAIAAEIERLAVPA